MKFQTFLSISALFAITIFMACKNDSAAAKDTPVENGGAQPAPGMPDFSVSNVTDPAASVTPATIEPPQNEKGVWHYTCAKGCAGGAGAAIPCAKCGTALTHNKDYHGPAAPTTASNPTATPGQTPGATPAPSAKQPEPPQNAAGVWHYTCAAGCAGGAGAAGNCAKCGGQLTHNKDYHAK